MNPPEPGNINADAPAGILRGDPAENILRLVPQKPVLLLCDIRQQAQPPHHVAVHLFVYIWDNFKPEPVPSVFRLKVGGISPAAPAEMLQHREGLLLGDIQKRPDHPAVSVPDSCKALDPCAPDHIEQHRLRAVALVVRHRNFNRTARFVFEPLRQPAKSIIAHLPGRRLHRQFLQRRISRHVPGLAPERHPGTFREFTRECLVLKRLAAPYHMVEMEGLKRDRGLPGILLQKHKKRPGVTASGECHHDDVTLRNQIPGAYGLFEFIINPLEGIHANLRGISGHGADNSHPIACNSRFIARAERALSGLRPLASGLWPCSSAALSSSPYS